MNNRFINYVIQVFRLFVHHLYDTINVLNGLIARKKALSATRQERGFSSINLLKERRRLLFTFH